METIIATSSESTAVRGDLPRFPEGWYCVATSKELKPGEVKALTVFGQELVLFRTESGKAVVLDAYCTHLGAHMGHGGTVVEETLRCPFHGYYYSTDGQCVKTDYGTGVPKKACTKSWFVEEKNDLIMLYKGEKGQAPTWSIPQYDYDGYQPIKTHAYELPTHVQDINENSVDLGHFTHVHGYSSVDVTEKPRIEGRALILSYAMIRQEGIVGYNKPFRQELYIEVHGMGFSHVDVKLPLLGINTRILVLTTPFDENTTILRIGSSVSSQIDDINLGRYLRKIPSQILAPILNQVIHLAYIKDVSRDFDIWKNKIYLENPAVMKGDGPIKLYRKYCQQFYTELAKQDKGHSNTIDNVELFADAG